MSITARALSCAVTTTIWLMAAQCVDAQYFYPTQQVQPSLVQPAVVQPSVVEVGHAEIAPVHFKKVSRLFAFGICKTCQGNGRGREALGFDVPEIQYGGNLGFPQFGQVTHSVWYNGPKFGPGQNPKCKQKCCGQCRQGECFTTESQATTDSLAPVQEELVPVEYSGMPYLGPMGQRSFRQTDAVANLPKGIAKQPNPEYSKQILRR